jgi:hypothetical protein
LLRGEKSQHSDLERRHDVIADFVVIRSGVGMFLHETLEGINSLKCMPDDLLNGRLSHDGALMSPAQHVCPHISYALEGRFIHPEVVKMIRLNVVRRVKNTYGIGDKKDPVTFKVERDAIRCVARGFQNSEIDPTPQVQAFVLPERDVQRIVIIRGVNYFAFGDPGSAKPLGKDRVGLPEDPDDLGAHEGACGAGVGSDTHPREALSQRREYHKVIGVRVQGHEVIDIFRGNIEVPQLFQDKWKLAADRPFDQGTTFAAYQIGRELIGA